MGEIDATRTIGRRIQLLRRKRGFSQEQLCAVLGFKDRQTISAIEKGNRRMSAIELIRLVEEFDVSLDYFTDPFQLGGEAQFSWRQTNIGRKELGDYENAASLWLGTYRALTSQMSPPPLMRQSLAIWKSSSFEESAQAGERFAEEFDLGDTPSKRLQTVMQNDLDILVLHVDTPEGISGAACRLPDLDAVLVSREETSGRRNFNLAHELFHILTWDSMPPDHIESATDTGGRRVEQLANTFASALLMPKEAIESKGDWDRLDMDELIHHLNVTAEELDVTSSALRWRLVFLRKLPKSVAKRISEPALRNNGRAKITESAPLFSQPFASVLANAIDQGHVSVRRAAKVVGLTIDDFQEFFQRHDVECGFDL